MKKKKIQFKARFYKHETEERLYHRLLALDGAGEKFTKRSFGRSSCGQKRIRFEDILREFDNDDIILVTFERVKK